MVGDFGQLISNPVCYICTKNKKTRLSKPFWNNMIKLPSTGARIGTNDNATIEFYSHNWRLNWKKYLKCKFHFNIKEFVNTYACAVFWCQPIRAEKIGNRIIHCTSHGWFKWNCWNWTTHYKTETVDSPLLSTSGFMVGHSILECVGRQLIYDFWSIM
jgi:hypothetical protein